MYIIDLLTANRKFRIAQFLLIFFCLNIYHSAYALDLELLGSVSESYDDNVNSSADNSEYDFYTDLMIGFGVNYEGKTQDIRLVGHVNQQIYYRNSDLNNNSQDVVFNYTKNITANQIFRLDDTFSHYPEPRNFNDTFGRAPNRDGYYTNRVNPSYFIQIIRQLSAAFRYVNIYTKNRSSVFVDSYTHSGGGTINYLWDSSNITSIVYDYIYTSYDSGVIMKEKRGGFQYQHYFTKQFYFIGNIGSQYIDSSNLEDKSFNMFYSSSLISDVDRNNNINLTYSYENTASPYTDEILKSQRVSGEFNQQTTNRFTLMINIFYGKGVYSISEATERLYGVLGRIRYAYSEQIDINFSYSYMNSKREADDMDDTEYDRNRILFELSMHL